MFVAVLTFDDYLVIGLLIFLFTGGHAAASAYFRPPDRNRLQRVEQKLDLLLTQLGIEYVPPLEPEWQVAADDPGGRLAAIRLYRLKHGANLTEAAKAVDEYIRSKMA